MGKANLVGRNEKTAEGVASGFQRITDAVVGSYERVENGVVGQYTKMEDKFVDQFLTKAGETVAEAKARLTRAQEERRSK